MSFSLDEQSWIDLFKSMTGLECNKSLTEFLSGEITFIKFAHENVNHYQQYFNTALASITQSIPEPEGLKAARDIHEFVNNTFRQENFTEISKGGFTRAKNVLQQLYFNKIDMNDFCINKDFILKELRNNPDIIKSQPGASAKTDLIIKKWCGF
jgi:hypothetical protein